MRKLLLPAFILFLVIGVQAQSGSVFFGASGLKGTADTDPVTGIQTVGGGTYLQGGAEFLIRHHLGVEGEVAWRAHQNLYGGFQPFRPIFFDINGVYAPQLGPHVGADLMAGIGAESIRFYTGQYVCSFTSCTNYQTSNHFLGHIGGRLRLYVHNGFFVGPEAHLYLVHNNVEFSSGKAARIGVSLGYTFGMEQP
ncbi:MAG TPA: hypothetical protein VFU76_08085 [Terriglobales bacterium]|nr:hypothetical protein [Terriglobales bacterium]